MSSSLRQYLFAPRAAALLVIIGALWWGHYQQQPPEPRPATADGTRFSAIRAMDHVREIAQTPHPSGSEEHAAVRQYLVEQLRTLGLQTSVRKATVANPDYGEAAIIHNVVGKIEGSTGDRTILLMAHYDSVPTSPGAADDASGVAAILEALRAELSKGKPAQNLVVLFSDAEEYGLYGAKHFFRQDTLSKSVDIVLNFEARGTSGASTMFESSSNNYSLIQLLSKYTWHPVANSLTYTVYQRMPNDTDFTLVKEAGIPGYNFAFIEKLLHYHTDLDNVENLSQGSLQHHGDYITGPMRRLNTEFPLDITSDYNAVYFNHIFAGLTYYPQFFSFILAGILVLLFVLACYKARQAARLPAGHFTIAVVGLLLLAVIIPGLVHLLWQVVRNYISGLEWMHYGLVYHHHYYFNSLLLTAAGVALPVLGWMHKRLGATPMVAASIFIWLIPALLLSWWMPGVSYLLLWPALFAVAGWGYKLLKLNQDQHGWLRLTLWAIVGFPVIYLVAPYIRLIFLSLTINMVGLCAALMILLVILLWPLVHIVIRDYEMYAGIALLVIGLGLMSYALKLPAFDHSHPRPVHLNYAIDADRNRAYWTSKDPALSDWTAKFISPASARKMETPFYSDSVWVSPVTLTPVVPPRVEDVEHRSASPPGTWSLKLIPQPGSTMLRLKPAAGTSFSSVSVNGVTAIDGGKAQDELHIFGGGGDTLEVEVSFSPGTAVDSLELLDYRARLPESVGGKEVPPWPSEVMARPGQMSRATVVYRTVPLEAGGNQ